MLKIKRIYDKPEKSDGFRILVDRLWPRGVSKEHARIDMWLREVGPSDKLRKWFNHEPAKWHEFKRRYKTELRKKQSMLENIRLFEKDFRTVTLVYSAKDEEHNQAVVLLSELRK